MELLLEAGAEAVEIFGDSKLVISQLTEEYKCESELLFPLVCLVGGDKPWTLYVQFPTSSSIYQSLCP